MSVRVVLAVLVLGGIACSGDTEHRADPAAEVVEEAPADGAVADGRSSAVSSGGSRVALRVEPFPVETGPVSFLVELPDAYEGTPTLDLVSPSMPMHGVVRYEASRAGGFWTFETEIPMEGDWLAYVNLDAGTDAAEFAFEVAAGEGGHDHGADAGVSGSGEGDGDGQHDHREGA